MLSVTNVCLNKPMEAGFCHSDKKFIGLVSKISHIFSILYHYFFHAMAETKLPSAPVHTSALGEN